MQEVLPPTKANFWHKILPTGEASRQVATKSILSPLLWLTAIVWLPALPTAIFASAPFNYVALAVGALVVLVALGMYVYFALNDPDRLHDEEYLLKQQMVARLGDNKTGNEITLTPAAAGQLTANTAIETSNG